MGSAGLTMQAVCLSAFVFAKGPLFGAACNAMYNFFKCFTNDGGYQTNYIEVGGPDTGVLYATGQTVANIPGTYASTRQAYSTYMLYIPPMHICNRTAATVFLSLCLISCNLSLVSYITPL